MTIEEIKQLVQLVNESGIAELEVTRGDQMVRIRRTAKAAREVVLPTHDFTPHAAASHHTLAAEIPRSSARAGR